MIVFPRCDREAGVKSVSLGEVGDRTDGGCDNSPDTLVVDTLVVDILVVSRGVLALTLMLMLARLRPSHVDSGRGK